MRLPQPAHGRALIHEISESAHSAAGCSQLGWSARDRARIAMFCLAAPWRRRRLNLRGRPLSLDLRIGGVVRSVEVCDVSELHALRDVLHDGEYRLDLPFAPRVIVDAGANIGAAALFFRSAYPDAIVVAAEPNPQTFARLVRNVAHDPCIYPVHGALVASSGPVQLVSTDTTWTSYVRPLTDPALCPEAAPGPVVPGLDLPALLDFVGCSEQVIDLLKLDIEGGEHSLFAGGMRESSTIRNLVVELHDDGSHRSYGDLLQPFLRGGDAVTWLAHHVAHVTLRDPHSVPDAT